VFVLFFLCVESAEGLSQGVPVEGEEKAMSMKEIEAVILKESKSGRETAMSLFEVRQCHSETTRERVWNSSAR